VLSAFLERWLEEAVMMPGATAIQISLVPGSFLTMSYALPDRGRHRPVIDIGQSGSPGIPLATMFPEFFFTLLESRAPQVRLPLAVSSEP
jgi:hypothetical protein